MLKELKEEVYEANMRLPEYGLVSFTWGNVSGVDRAGGYMVIKPSGVEYEKLRPADMVVIDIGSGAVAEGSLRPSSDTPTHLELYRAFEQTGGVVHTHSPYATAWAQAGRDIPCYGTTHADYFYGSIPCLRALSGEEIKEAYEENTGRLIVNEFAALGLDEKAMPGCLCRCHGPFCWGRNAAEAVHNAAVLEEVAKLALRSEALNAGIVSVPQELMDKHYERKHGANAYYGQS